jgi:hypothetical protein
MSESPLATDGMYVAYCDILGFSELTTSHFDATLKLYSELGDVITGFAQEDVEVTIYSDAVLLTSLSLTRISQAVQNLWFFALQHNMMIRGAITQGKYWELRRGKCLLVMSDALVRAVRLERLVGVPAVVLADDIEVSGDLWAARFRLGAVAAPLLHFRDRTIVNPFNLFWFRSARGRATLLMEEHPKYRDKYLWFLALHAAIEADAELVPPEALAKLLSSGTLVRGEKTTTST